MEFLSPWSGLIAAAVAVPLLVLLYLLKLRRQPATVASTLLWRRSFEDLQVNAPFQRLRWSALLAIQLLALLLLVLAFAQPVASGGVGPASRIVLLIDRSASMNTLIDPETTRLDAARAQAKQIVDRLGASNEPARCMIITFARTARVVSGFESDASVLRAAIDAITPTDEAADIQAAFEVAGAFAQQDDEATRSAMPPRIVLLSDGCVGEPGDPGGFRLRAGSLEFVRIGEQAAPADAQGEQIGNLGITAFAAERDFEDPTTVQLFVRLTNSSTAAIRTVLTIGAIDSAAQADVRPIIRTVSVPARDEAGPGTAGVTASLTLPRGGVLMASHAHEDPLEVDDVAALVLPPPRQPRLALVHPQDAEPDSFLLELLEAFEADTLDIIDLAAFEALDPARLDAGDLYDMIIFDRAAASRLPAIATLTIGATPPGIGSREAADSAGRRITTWQRQHPMMRHVELDGIVYARFGSLELPAGAEVLASGPDGPVIAMSRSRGAEHVVVGFEMQRSNWSIDVSFTVFMINVLDQAMLGRSGRTGRTLRPGETYTLRPRGDVRQVLISGPREHTVDIGPQDIGRPVVGPRLSRAGTYAVQGTDAPLDTLTVSVLSEQETDNQPRASIRVNAEQRDARASDDVSPRPLWPYLLVAAAGVLILEWLLWSGKAGGFTGRAAREVPARGAA